MKTLRKKLTAIISSMISLSCIFGLSVLLGHLIAPYTKLSLVPTDQAIYIQSQNLQIQKTQALDQEMQNKQIQNIEDNTIKQKLSKLESYEKDLQSKHQAIIHILSNIDALDIIQLEPNAIGGDEENNEKKSLKNNLTRKLEAGIKTIKSLPLGTPTLGEISSSYGYRISPFTKKKSMHSGIDIKMTEHSQVLSTADGVISFAGVKGGYGNVIEIEHGQNFKTIYAHLSKINVKQGQKVCREQIIGLVGSTGRSTGPHLHYEVRKFNIAQNPKNYIDAANLLKLAVES